jgi:hypothetical protein
MFRPRGMEPFEKQPILKNLKNIKTQKDKTVNKYVTLTNVA